MSRSSLGLFQTRSRAGWTVGAAGLIAFGLGVAGLVNQDAQLRAVGLDPGEYPRDDPLRITMATSSVAAINNGAVYLVGTAKSWPWFPALTVAARTAQAAVFLSRIASGRAPRAYLGAAIWEAAGAAITAAAMVWDRRSHGPRGRSARAANPATRTAESSDSPGVGTGVRADGIRDSP
ncbi:MAG TPA: hypothetical protein VH141_23710 [Pseudonocardia sp.]|nr:hypothetical protein [Pseudonocardia sp.]